MTKKTLSISAAVLVVIFAGVGYVYRDMIRDVIFEFQRPVVPEPMTKEQAANLLKNVGIVKPEAPLSPDQVVRKNSEVPVLPDEINLDVPFTPQAPFAVWDAFHDDACEEASVLMVGRFWKNLPILSPADADSELRALGKLEDKLFGQNKDTDSQDTARFMQEFYGFTNIGIRYNITIDDIKAEVGRGYPVIVPVDGRGPLNPYFRGNGPAYHMLVIKGYTKDGQFITNDPGTKRGQDYVYDEKYLFDKIHDFNNGDVLNGRRAMIVARPN